MPVSLPDKVVIAYEQQVLQYREEIGLSSTVLYHTLHHVEHIPGISVESQGLVLSCCCQNMQKLIMSQKWLLVT